jgi:16S rRNA (cytidine1402-2'-O)-methyltransferase
MNNAADHKNSNSNLVSGALYLVPTPIGNLKDITLRALETLEAADGIICEDTRVTSRLLEHYNIKKTLYNYHDHSSQHVKEQIIKMLLTGKTLALVSDAGTPMLSDPGYKLGQALIEHNIPIVSLPGPSSITTALTLSGLPTDQFYFIGFLPPKSQRRIKLLQSLQHLPASIIFFESPKRIQATLKDIETVFPSRLCAITRELTKKFEEAVRGTAKEILAYSQDHELRGEIVGIIAPTANEDKVTTLEEMHQLLIESLKVMSLKDAVDHVNSMSSFPKKEIYKEALTLQNN